VSNILLVTSSPRGSESLSSKFAGQLADKLQSLSPGGAIVHRDLGAAPIPHLDAVSTAAIRKPADARTPEEAAAAAYSDQLVAELLHADTLIIATGLINFSIYSTLKSWIDNVARAGLTFKYTETGPVGLATGKKAYVVLSSGGVYSAGSNAANDHAIPYLKTILGFLGVTDIEVLYLEGLAYGPEAAEKATQALQSKISALSLAA
jgi:FMN-dependent NADH-azoreductase